MNADGPPGALSVKAALGRLAVIGAIGWSMLSAGGYPIVRYGPIHLPKIAPQNDHALLRSAHAWLASLFFATVLLHLGAALFHALLRRDHGAVALRIEASCELHG